MKRNIRKVPEGFDRIVKNGEILIRLKDSKLDKDQLADRCRLSTKTIYRRTKELVERGYVTKEGHQYALTNVGRFYSDMLVDDVQLFNTIDSNRDIFSNVDSKLFPRFLVTSANLISLNDTFSEPLAELIDEQLWESKSVRAIFGHFGRRHLEVLRRISSETNLQIVIHTNDYSVLKDDHIGDFNYVRELATELQATQIDFPHSILKFDDSVGVEFNTDGGNRKATIISSGQEVQKWARKKYATYKDNS